MNRKRIILMILLGVLAICLVYAYLATPRLVKAPPKQAAVNSRARLHDGERLATPADRGRIDFAFLGSELQDFPGAHRDIFRFGRSLAVRSTSPPPVAKPPAQTTVMNTVVLQETEPVPIEVVQQSLSRFTFLGFLEKAGEKTVFLSSGGNLFVAKAGEPFGSNNEFLVVAIEGNLLQVRYAGRDDLIEIPLVERQKLSAAVSAPARLPADVVTEPPSRARTLTPIRKTLQPSSPRGAEEALPESIKEYDPAQEQESVEPVDGDVLEGDINGTNQ